MELEQIKRHVLETQPTYSQAEIEDIFSIRTKKSLSKVNSNMFWDAVFMGLSVVGLVSVTFVLGLKDKYLISIEIIGLAFCLLIHYRIKHRLLNRFNFEIDIQNAAKRLVNSLSSFMRLYLWLVPSAISVLYLYIQFRLYHLSNWLIFETTVRFALVIPLLLITLFLTKGLIRIMYQRHLDELKEIIKNLN